MFTLPARSPSTCPNHPLGNADLRLAVDPPPHAAGCIKHQHNVFLCRLRLLAGCKSGKKNEKKGRQLR